VVAAAEQLLWLVGRPLAAGVGHHLQRKKASPKSNLGDRRVKRII
jgi:hypothetical protein